MNPDGASGPVGMDQLSVSEARQLLQQAVAKAASKETELQLMVGSRYHDLIESADAIVSMHSTAAELVRLLEQLPALAGPLLDAHERVARPQAHQPEPWGVSATFCDRRSDGDDAQARTFKAALRHPPRIWAALDRHQYHAAAKLLLSCPMLLPRRGAVRAVSATSEFQLYSQQFPALICQGARRAVRQKQWTSEHFAGSLAALIVLDEMSWRSAIELFFRIRTRWLSRSLDALSADKPPDGWAAAVLSRLRSALCTVRRSVIDAFLLFAASGVHAPSLVDAHVQELLRAGERPAQPASVEPLPVQHVVALTTDWLAISVRLVLERSRDALKCVPTAGALASIRQGLWDETRRTADGGDASLAPVWAAACAVALDHGKLAVALADLDVRLPSSASPGGGGRHEEGTLRVDLWSLLFSRTFAELGEGLLQSSLNAIRHQVQTTLDAVLSAVIQQDSSSPNTSVSSAECTWAAERIGDLLNTQLSALAEDAHSLVQHGDAAAAQDLQVRSPLATPSLAFTPCPSGPVSFGQVSLYLRLVEMLACLVNHLRRRVDKLMTPDLGGGAARARAIDGVLLVARVTRCLRGGNSAVTSDLLRVPAVLATPTPDQISIEQLQATFTVADIYDDGVMAAAEANKVIADSMAGGSLRVDAQSTPELTFDELALLATSLLEVQQPTLLLGACLDTVFVRAHELWAKSTVSSANAALSAELTVLVASATEPDGAKDAASWRMGHGMWVEKKMESEATADGEGLWVPASISNGLYRFLFQLAAELNRVTSSTDVLARVNPDPSAVGGETIAAHIRSALRRELEEGLAAVYLEHSSVIARADAACEPAVLQLLTDVLFLETWLRGGSGESATERLRRAEATLKQRIDFVELQLYEPHLHSHGHAPFEDGSLMLAVLTGPSTDVARAWPNGCGHSSANDAPGSTSTNLMQLAKPSKRLSVLPLPLDSLAADSAGANLSPKGHDSSEHAALGMRSGGAAGSETKGFSFMGQLMNWR